MGFWKNGRRYGWMFGTLLGVLLIGIGVAQGQFVVIWKKAVMICMECIGIGCIF